MQIVNGLYLGNFRDSRDPAQLMQNCITHIVSIHDNAKPLQAVSHIQSVNSVIMEELHVCIRMSILVLPR